MVMVMLVVMTRKIVMQLRVNNSEELSPLSRPLLSQVTTMQDNIASATTMSAATAWELHAGCRTLDLCCTVRLTAQHNNEISNLSSSLLRFICPRHKEEREEP